ncbi:MAG: proline dehydrogenase family protein [Pyrinomonadaceae bacterium]|jgi:proline dehydrogenase|nr:proline dehydrogenase family protein [Pyrinomonadaceae bacterium]
MSNLQLNLQDTEIAFADKSNADLKKRYWLFKLMNSEMLNTIGTKCAELSLRWHLPIKWMFKATIYKHFCGGETIEECEPTVIQLANSNIGSILDYSIEGRSEEEDFGRTKDEIIRTIERAKSDNRVPFAVFKMTGIAPLGTLEKVSTGIELTEKGEWKWERIKTRVDEICQFAHSINQQVFIDAEESWIQNAIDQLATEMMEKYNRERPLIFNTIQLYRHDRLEFLKKSHQIAKENGYFLAVKLVRGAYMEKERERAIEKNYPSPIQPDKNATDRDYNLALRYCVENIKDIAVCAGSHNENSVELLAQLLQENNLSTNHPNVFFSQLYGMSDNLSYNLANGNYNVSKYVPYGPVKDTLPYLIRRAEENSAVAGQMSRELDLITRELKRRKL